MTFTPLKGVSEVVRRFLLEKSPDRHVTAMTIDDAEHYSAGGARNGSSPAIRRTRREARTKGMPVLGSGRIFPIAEADDHLRASSSFPEHWPRIGGMDFGWDHPFAAVEVRLGSRHRHGLCRRGPIGMTGSNAGHSRRRAATLGQDLLGLAA